MPTTLLDLIASPDGFVGQWRDGELYVEPRFLVGAGDSAARSRPPAPAWIEPDTKCGPRAPA